MAELSVGIGFGTTGDVEVRRTLAGVNESLSDTEKALSAKAQAEKQTTETTSRMAAEMIRLKKVISLEEAKRDSKEYAALQTQLRSLIVARGEAERIAGEQAKEAAAKATKAAEAMAKANADANKRVNDTFALPDVDKYKAANAEVQKHGLLQQANAKFSSLSANAYLELGRKVAGYAQELYALGKEGAHTDAQVRAFEATDRAIDQVRVSLGELVASALEGSQALSAMDVGFSTVSAGLSEIAGGFDVVIESLGLTSDEGSALDYVWKGLGETWIWFYTGPLGELSRGLDLIFGNMESVYSVTAKYRAELEKTAQALALTQSIERGELITWQAGSAKEDADFLAQARKRTQAQTAEYKRGLEQQYQEIAATNKRLYQEDHKEKSKEHGKGLLEEFSLSNPLATWGGEESAGALMAALDKSVGGAWRAQEESQKAVLGGLGGGAWDNEGPLAWLKPAISDATKLADVVSDKLSDAWTRSSKSAAAAQAFQVQSVQAIGDAFVGTFASMALEGESFRDAMAGQIGTLWGQLSAGMLAWATAEGNLLAGNPFGAIAASVALGVVGVAIQSLAKRGGSSGSSASRSTGSVSLARPERQKALPQETRELWVLEVDGVRLGTASVKGANKALTRGDSTRIDANLIRPGRRGF